MAVQTRETMAGGGDHVVQFYEQEGDLVPAVGEYLFDAVSAVADDSRARFRAGPEAPFAARRFVAGLLGRHEHGGRVDSADAQLVVSELATNAVMHAGTPFSVALRCDGSAIRISVHDWSSTQPVMRDGNIRAVSGRGLRLIDMVARSWGVERDPDGKTVWAELPLR